MMESIEEFGIKKILVAVDTSDYSEMVIARASAIALAFSAGRACDQRRRASETSSIRG